MQSRVTDYSQMQVEQTLLLPAHFIKLPLQIAGARPALLVIVRCPSHQRATEPVSDRSGLFEFDQNIFNALLDFFFAQSNARMPRGGVSRTAIVDVFLTRFFLDDFAGDRPTAVAAENHLTGVSQFMSFVDFVAKKFLYARESWHLDDRIMPARYPAIVILHVTNVSPIA